MKNSDSFARFKILSGSVLKLLAMLAMLVDHAAYTFRYQFPVLETALFSFNGTTITPYYLMRCIGRLAFPIFCFLIAEGIAHTKDVRKYGARLLVFAALSEIPFNLMMTHNWWYMGRQNVFFTLCLGVLMVYIYENVRTQWKKWLCMVLVLAITVLLRPDYGVAGVVLVFVMHLFRQRVEVQTVLAYPLMGRISALAAFVPIAMYNGKRGFIQSGVLKYVFYLFYPLHMLALVGISYWLYRQGIWG